MANNQSPSIMSTSMNMAITIFGFVLSALFIMVICCRLLCSRFRQNNNPLDIFQNERRSTIERSIHGMEPSVVTCFPTIKYNQQIFTSSEDNLCTICLGDYKEKEVLRILPRCGHAFHIGCIDLWLRQHHTCPVCRISLQIFSEWTQITGPLISLLAKPRFQPGALPDYLFEIPKNFRTVPVGLPSGPSNESLCWPVVADGGVDLEAGESSSWRHHEPLGHVESELEVGDRQQLLEPRLHAELDSSLHHEARALSPNEQAMSRNGCMFDPPKEAELSTHRNVAADGNQGSASLAMNQEPRVR